MKLKGTTTYVGKDGTRITVTGHLQTIYSEPQKLLVKKYLSPKGEKLLANKEITKKEAWEKYGKNRYTINPNSKPIKTIVHQI